MLETVTFDGAPRGMNAAMQPHEIGDDQARLIIDYLVDKPGLMRGRGPISYAAGIHEPTEYGVGLFQTIDPTGAHRVGYIAKYAGDDLYFSFLNSAYSANDGAIAMGMNTGGQSAEYIVDAKPALKSGTLLGVLKQYEPGSDRRLFLWKGGRDNLYSAGTITSNYNSKTVTGVGSVWSSGSTFVTPGMFLVDGTNGALIGCVASVDSDTQITLEENALHAAAGSTYYASPVRCLQARATKGRITTQTGSALVDGFNTKFKDQMGSGTWRLFRARDLTYIGTVTSIQDNENLTLTANAAIALTDERYIGVEVVNHLAGADELGSLTCVYADRQWYVGMDGKLRFSDPADREAVDLSEVDGDFIPVPSSSGTATTPPKALVSAYNSLLVLKESEAYAVFGESPVNFDLRKVADDGVLCGMSAVPWGGGVVFAGKNGIYIYDGQSVTNIVEDTLGDYYRSCVRAFDPQESRMWGMVERDHYLLHVESVTPPVAVAKGNTATTPTRLTFCIHLPSRAVTLMTNVDIRGSLELPANLGRSNWFLINGSFENGRFCDAAALFDSNGRDITACLGNTAGPDFYIETKRYSLGDHLLKKLWKQLLLTFLVTGDNLQMDTVLGLNDAGATASSEWETSLITWQGTPAVAPTWDDFLLMFDTWDETGASRLVTKRIKFLKRSTHIGFRIYPKSTDVTTVLLGPWQIGFKPQRPGRI